MNFPLIAFDVTATRCHLRRISGMVFTHNFYPIFFVTYYLLIEGAFLPARATSLQRGNPTAPVSMFKTAETVRQQNFMIGIVYRVS